MTELERLTEILNKANGIKQNHKEMSFDSIPKFSFKISDKNDFDENIFKFDSIKEFATLVNNVCENISLSKATEVVTELLNENNIDEEKGFVLTVFTS